MALFTEKKKKTKQQLNYSILCLLPSKLAKLYLSNS